MEFVKVSTHEIKEILNRIYLRDLEHVLNYIIDNFSKEDIVALDLPKTIYDKKKRHLLNKTFMVNLLIKINDSLYFKQRFYDALSKTKVSQYIYAKLIWSGYPLVTQTIIQDFNISLPTIKDETYYHESDYLKDELALVIRSVNYNYVSKKDVLLVQPDMKNLLKLFYPVPDDYKIVAISELSPTKYHYSNEDGVLPFIQNIQDMLENNLIDFGKTNEKPMVKSLNLLKASNIIEDFYQEKKIDTLALDMLTRSFYYYKSRFIFKDKELDTLSLFMEYQLKGAFRFTISRIFTSHLKRVRFGKYINEEKELFEILQYLIAQMPKEGWVSFENILSHTYYRELYFDFEDRYRTQHYEFLSDEKSKYSSSNKILEVGDHHGELFHEPILKGIFFYMGALGLMELKYDDPVTPYEKIKAEKRPYISVWDSLKYVKLTKLGEYIFGFIKSYTPKEIVVKKVSKVKFDEFQPIITVDKTDTILIAKLEPFTEKLDNNRYKLSHSKLFRDCKHLKALKLKIDSFYSKIEKNPPKVFIDFFNETIENSNLMKRNLKQVVIELESNKKLLNLFMTNRKLQELLIKAEGYRIIVFKEDISKISKIVKDNGFFIEF